VRFLVCHSILIISLLYSVYNGLSSTSPIDRRNASKVGIAISYVNDNSSDIPVTETQTDTEMLSHGLRNRMSTSLEMGVRLKLNAKALA